MKNPPERASHAPKVPHVPHLINHDLAAHERERLIDVTAQPFRERQHGDLRARFPMRLRNPTTSAVVWEYAGHLPNVQHPFALVTNGVKGDDGAVELSVVRVDSLAVEQP